MSGTLAEQALARVLSYLHGAGVDITPAVTADVLRLIGQALMDDPQRLLARVMQRLPDHFDLPAPPLPSAVPALHRGSIRYAAQR
ncbi:hypothetical protein [Alloalcanivorax mobilis]|uniref:hypothetical protein n=1 Tax=Alloalcanivorax mobilis TaxID=2019569 RepID=UPI000C75F808|nr:hypothetical protein [Alloalcanivorax mobilis]